jgi:TPR repeat protein
LISLSDSNDAQTTSSDADPTTATTTMMTGTNGLHCVAPGDDLFDMEEAMRWWLLAADQGHLCAANLLATAHYNGSVGPRDYGEAVRWWQRAARAGDADAQYRLACAYSDGRGPVRNAKLAADWWQKAAASGHTGANFELGVAAWHGRGMERSVRIAARCWRAAADAGDRDARRLLQFAFRRQLDARHRRRLPSLRRLTASGNADAMYTLANAHIRGLAVPIDIHQAIGLLRQGADLKHKAARRRLKRLYRERVSSARQWGQ